MKTLLAAAAVLGAVSPALAAPRPAVGDAAPTVTLTSTEGDTVDLAESFDDAKTVLVVLRGYPGYQCPVCSVQATSYLRQAKKFRDQGVNVVLVYPGEAADLDAKADEFLAGVTEKMKRKQLPKNVTVLLDPDYKLVDAYGLRWEAPNETAYPATYVIEESKVAFARVSESHGGRLNAMQALEALGATEPVAAE